MILRLKDPNQVRARLSRYGRTPGFDQYGHARALLLQVRNQSVREVWSLTHQRHQDAVARAKGHRCTASALVGLAELAWLLGRDDLSRELRYWPGNIEPFGMPVLRKFAEGMRLPFPNEGQDYLVWRMGQGWPCKPECTMGCHTEPQGAWL